MKKRGLVYNILLVLVLLIFIISPRFGWYVKDNFTNSKLLYYAGQEKYGDEKAIHYRGGKTELIIYAQTGTSEYQIHYQNEELAVTQDWKWEDYTHFRERLGNVPFALQLVGERLYWQDKQVRIWKLLPGYLLLGGISLLTAWLQRKAVQQNNKLKKELLLAVCVIITFFYVGSCLRFFHWKWLP